MNWRNVEEQVSDWLSKRAAREPTEPQHPTVMAKADLEDGTSVDLELRYLGLNGNGVPMWSAELPDEGLTSKIISTRIIRAGNARSQIHLPRIGREIMSSKGTDRRSYRFGPDDRFELLKRACRFFGITVTDNIVRAHNKIIEDYERALKQRREERNGPEDEESS